MDYEKAYKEALERAKKWRNALNSDKIPTYANRIIEEIFSELKESEDEQSKKWILEYLYDGLRKSDEQFKGQFKTAIAWLEKQGEQNNLVEQLTAFAQHLNKRGAFRGDLCMDFEHEAQSFIEMQNNKEI